MAYQTAVSPTAVGRRFAPVTATVEAGRLRYFLNTLGETGPLFRSPQAAQDAGLPGCPIPPTYLFCLEMMDAERPFAFLEDLGIDLARILHGEQSFTYHQPVCVGDSLHFVTTVDSVTDKKGGAMTLIAFTTTVTNQSGTHVADCVRTVVVRNPEVS